MQHYRVNRLTLKDTSNVNTGSYQQIRTITNKWQSNKTIPHIAGSLTCCYVRHSYDRPIRFQFNVGFLVSITAYTVISQGRWHYIDITKGCIAIGRADQDVTGGDDGDECDTSDIKVINARGMIQVGALPHQRGEETSPPCRCRRLGSDPLGWAARSRSRSAPLGSSLSPRADSAAERAARTVLS